MGKLFLHGQTEAARAGLEPALDGCDISVEPGIVTVTNALLVPPVYRYPPRGKKPAKPATGVYDENGSYVRASGAFRGPQLEDAPHGGRPLADVTDAMARPAPSHETAVYGGYFRGHYGHLLLEGFARLWHLLTLDRSVPILIHVDPEGSPELAALNRLLARLEPLDFDFSRLVFCHQPTTVRTLIVPEPALHIRHGVSQRFFDACMAMAKGIACPDETDQPLYLSRAGLKNDARAIMGEAEIEKAIERSGGRVLRLEKMGFVDGIIALRRHRRIIGPAGSAFHGTVFAPNKRHYYLTNGIDPRKLRTYATLDFLNAQEAHFLRLTDAFEDGRSETWHRKLCHEQDHPVLIDPDETLRMLWDIGAIDERPSLTSDERATVRRHAAVALEKSVAEVSRRSSFLTRHRLKREAAAILA